MPHLMISVVLVGLFLSFPSFSQNKGVNDSVHESKDLREFSRFLDNLEQENRLSGSFLLARNGKVIFNKSVGSIHPSRQTKITTNSSINIGSISKQFTAASIMILKQRNRLGYDDLVVKHIKNFPYHNITIRHLLQHTSGLIDYEELTDKYWKSLKFTNQDMVNLYVKYKPKLEFPPNSQFEYSNTGYVLLAAIVETVSSQTLEEFSEQNIFKPLEMNDTRVFTIFSQNQNFPNRVYGQEDGQLFDKYHIEGVTGDGGVYSTTHDLLKWHLALQSHKLFSKPELEEAFQQLKLDDGSKFNYAFGWIVNDNFKGLQTHDGSWLAFTSFLTRNENSNDFLVFLTSHRDNVNCFKLRNKFVSAANAKLALTNDNFIFCVVKGPKND